MDVQLLSEDVFHLYGVIYTEAKFRHQLNQYILKLLFNNGIVPYIEIKWFNNKGEDYEGSREFLEELMNRDAQVILCSLKVELLKTRNAIAENEALQEYLIEYLLD